MQYLVSVVQLKWQKGRPFLVIVPQAEMGFPHHLPMHKTFICYGRKQNDMLHVRVSACVNNKIHSGVLG